MTALGLDGFARAFGLAAVVVMLLGCMPRAPAPVTPMRTVAFPIAVARDDTRCLLVLLPGLGDAPEDFETNGFVRILDESGVDAVVVAADAHFGYYRDEVFVERITADVLDPALERYDDIWLVGISMGGMGALAAAAARPEAIRGVVLIAPYLGSGAVIDEIEARGGAAEWARAAPPLAPEFWKTGETGFFRGIWTFATRPERRDGTRVELHLGYGRDDRFAQAQSLLAGALPARSLRVAAGGHRWPVWRDLFRVFVAEGFLQRSCNRRR
jgi:pimeloyl-ACP methyl ester carboxylesterase